MESLHDILAQNLARTGTPALAVPLAWRLAAGPELAPQAICCGLTGGALRLQPADAAARALIASISAELLPVLRRLLGPQCERLEFLPCR